MYLLRKCLYGCAYIVRSAFLLVVQVVFLLFLVVEFTGGDVHADFDLTVVARLIDGFDKDIQCLKQDTASFLLKISPLSLPLSPFSMFGAKPPSSPTLVASRPYSALILDERSTHRSNPKAKSSLQVLQMMVHLRAHAHGFLECLRSCWQEHEFLHGKFIASMAATVDDLARRRLSSEDSERRAYIERRNWQTNRRI